MAMEEVSGENGLTYARYKNTATGEVAEYKSKETFGVFVFAGYEPATEMLKGIVDLNEQGYIVTDESQKTRTACTRREMCVSSLCVRW